MAIVGPRRTLPVIVIALTLAIFARTDDSLAVRAHGSYRVDAHVNFDAIDCHCLYSPSALWTRVALSRFLALAPPPGITRCTARQDNVQTKR